MNAPGGNNWSAGRWHADQRPGKKQSAAKQLSWPIRDDNSDQWIERYLSWLSREAARLGGGAIARHYIGCAQAAYTEYYVSGDVSTRYRAWLAIRTCARWLAQLERGFSQWPR